MKRHMVCMAMLLWCGGATASSPRWIANVGTGLPVRWQLNTVQYFVDPGPLSQSVSNAAAVAMVDAAAAVWNVPQASLVLQDGGTLAEDVNESDVFLGPNGLIWPADVQASTAGAKNIAVIFDADGAITDLLLGVGASDAENCMQNGVTSTVDGVSAPAWITHAIVIVNGRCSGAATEQQLQMQYQLERVFGRVIGLGWSQLNDNVFTGAPAPSFTQQQHWPIMHPIDIVCGLYTYECLPDAFTLRDDDVASVGYLYPIAVGSVAPAGKEVTLAHGAALQGYVTFPDGIGMADVNVTVRRVLSSGVIEDWQEASSVSGFLMSDAAGNPVSGTPAVSSLPRGSTNRASEGYYFVSRVPILAGYNWENLYVYVEPVNPLYVGQYAVGPFHAATVTPDPPLLTQFLPTRGPASTARLDFAMGLDAVDCSPGPDGTEVAPAMVAVGGVWAGRICGAGHTAWMAMEAKAGHTMTMEATAQDETGVASEGKARLLIGVWNASDATGTLPTVAASPTVANGRLPGTTHLMLTVPKDEQLRFAIADQRGEGRPDFGYRARVLYADTVTPVRLPSSGGRVEISGSGFQPGNVVTVAGVLATVESLSSSTIVATVPGLTANVATNVADVEIADLATGGTTLIPGGLTFGSAAGDVLGLVRMPMNGAAVGTAASVPMGVRLVDVQGAAVANVPIAFSAMGAVLGCGMSACTVTTDATGYAETAVVPRSVGAVMLTASAANGSSVSVSFTANAAAAKSVSGMKAMQYVAAGAAYAWQPQVLVEANGVPAIGMSVSWNGGPATATNSAGIATGTMNVTLSGGEQGAVQACAWTSVCANVLAQGVDASLWTITATAGVGQVTGASSTLSAVTVQVTDGSGDAVAGAPVSVSQAVEGWQVCPVSGACAQPPVYGMSSVTAVSDANGMVTLMPMQYANTAEVTKIAVAAGPNGYLALELEKHP